MLAIAMSGLCPPSGTHVCLIIFIKLYTVFCLPVFPLKSSVSGCYPGFTISHVVSMLLGFLCGSFLVLPCFLWLLSFKEYWSDIL